VATLLVDRAPIVVATSGRGRSKAVIEMARLLARRHKRSVHVMAVLEPFLWYGIDGIASREVAMLEEQSRTELRRAVHAELVHVLGAAHDWTIHVRTGHVARCVADLAREAKAGLIVVGLGRRSPLDRLFGRETALRTIRMAPCPILAVGDDAVGLPRRAIIATDFSASSVHAASAALPLLADDAEVTLMHVRPPAPAIMPIPAHWERPYAARVADLFVRMRGRLAAQADVVVQVATARGDAVDEVLDLAQDHEADLLVAGSHGHGLVERLLVGSMATGLLKRAHCSVFIAPQPSAEEADRIQHALSHETLTRNPEEFAEMLAGFSRRNAGRLARLEVDDPLIGAQVQEEGYALMGAAYDPNDRRVQLMLGEPGGAIEQHLTRSIADATSLMIVADDDDRDVALRVQHGDGQTLLEFA